MIEPIIRWFIGSEAACSRTDYELARTFVFTHLFGPLIAQPMAIYLFVVSPEVSWPLVVLAVMVSGFWTLPFLLRLKRNMTLVSFLSFQMLVTASLFGAYHFGGFSSPFLPWLVVSLLLGLFYLARHTAVVLTLFAASVGVFLGAVALNGLPERVPFVDLAMVGWLSIAAATTYMAWMALCYARLVGLRRELEDEVARSRATWCELERARSVALETGEARARFFSKMSHELRTPLNAIIGYSDILLDDCQEPADPAQPGRARDVARINAAGKHLLSLVADVLDTDRIESEALNVEAGPIQLGDLCDDVVASALPRVTQNDNRFVVICPRRGYRLFTDATKLRQILINLLGNAGKFTTGGTVRLELYVETRPGGDELRAVVSDTGIGIGSDVLPRLFQEYEQGDASVARRYGGSGIGLALTRRFSVLLGGEINVASAPGRGSAFTLRIPAHLDACPADAGLDHRAAAAAASRPAARRAQAVGARQAASA